MANFDAGASVAESFFSAVENELRPDDDAEILNRPQWRIRQLVLQSDGYYSREGRHSTTDHLSPIDYGEQVINTSTLLTEELWQQIADTRFPRIYVSRLPRSGIPPKGHH